MKKVKVLAIAFLVSGVLFSSSFIQNFFKTPAQIINDEIKVGWNLGNSLDCKNDYGSLSVDKAETFWGNPKVNKELIVSIKKAGFNCVRVPITWQNHIDENGKVDIKWLDRVQEVVDMAYGEGLYVIINLHHENWAVPKYENKEVAAKKMCNIWSQVGQRFANYDNKLIFETFNEPRFIGEDIEWTGNKEGYEVVNYWNEVFISHIRNMEDGNKNRTLIIPTYCEGVSEDILKGFKIPSDKNTIVSVHIYLPYDFALNESGTNKWSKDKKEDTYEIDKTLENLHNYFNKNNVPVMITEYGAIYKNNDEDIKNCLEYLRKRAKRFKIRTSVWDDGKNFRLIDRHNYSLNETILEGVID